MAEERTGKPAWYAAHTYAGYENKVKLDIEQTIKNRNLEKFIFEVRVPTKMVTEIKKGKEVRTEKKLFPGYVLVNMILTDDTWYIIRNTRGVTGFVGPDTKAVPIPEDQILNIHEEQLEVVIEYNEGDLVIVTNGPFKDSNGRVVSVNSQKKILTVGIDIMGRETPVEIGFYDVKKI